MMPKTFLLAQMFVEKSTRLITNKNSKNGYGTVVHNHKHLTQRINQQIPKNEKSKSQSEMDKI